MLGRPAATAPATKWSLLVQDSRRSGRTAVAIPRRRPVAFWSSRLPRNLAIGLKPRPTTRNSFNAGAKPNGWRGTPSFASAASNGLPGAQATWTSHPSRAAGRARSSSRSTSAPPSSLLFVVHE